MLFSLWPCCIIPLSLKLVSSFSDMSWGGNFFTYKFWGNTNQGYYPIIDNRLAHLEPLLGKINVPNTRDSKDPLLHAKPISDMTNKIPKEAERQVQITICQSGGGQSHDNTDPSQSGDSDTSSSDSEDNNFQVKNLEEEKAEVEASKAKEEDIDKTVEEEKIIKRKKESSTSPVTKKTKKRKKR